MQKHTRVYLDYFGYSGYEYLPCEVCQCHLTDIHHVVPRSKFGSKTKDQQDKIENLIGLCRPCHDKAHDGTYSKEYLTEIHNAFMGK